MESTLTAKAELSIVFLSLLLSLVLDSYGYYIGEVTMLLSRSEDYLNKTSPGQGIIIASVLERILTLDYFVVSTNFAEAKIFTLNRRFQLLQVVEKFLRS
ncbi:MAG: hypothetical protein KME60_04940 [Cyanomargarita calcarea GSE-NOS-MK-12-04C]|jgi:hypothetical protein|uniref:Uncharacterized protein n=1 Tax=Cyanomargarita calcarea GSE-NOS-MK-12-04C TaxID=2839659 RepID=A0A951QKR5_9CYAN|nr:hypothetical protein [Cyanomargarita calcarea GSE-NOS-MK-12-04C]